MTDKVWIATNWHGQKRLLTEVYLKPDRVFTVDAEGLLHVAEDGKIVHLGQLIGFSSNPELLKQALGIDESVTHSDEDIFLVPAK